MLVRVLKSGATKKKSADERRIVARPFEFLGRRVAVDVAAVVYMRRERACELSPLILAVGEFRLKPFVVDFTLGKRANEPNNTRIRCV